MSEPYDPAKHPWDGLIFGFLAATLTLGLIVLGVYGLPLIFRWAT